MRALWLARQLRRIHRRRAVRPNICLGDTEEVGTDRLLGIIQAMAQQQVRPVAVVEKIDPLLIAAGELYMPKVGDMFCTRPDSGEWRNRVL